MASSSGGSGNSDDCPNTSLASPSGNCVDPDDLDRQIVRAALLERLLDDGFRGPVEVLRIVVDRVGDEAGADVLVDAVGRQQKDIALLDRQRPIVDLDLRIDAERAAEIALFRRNDDAMIVGELLERVAGQPVDAGIADMEDDAPWST